MGPSNPLSTLRSGRCTQRPDRIIYNPDVFHGAMNLFSTPEDLPTPCVVVDADRLGANITRYAEGLRRRQVAMWPHAKTHKSTRIAALQQQAGATGLTIATLDEAEVFAKAGNHNLFVSYCTWIDRIKARRILAMLDEGVRIRLGADSVESIEQIGRQLSGRDGVSISIEVDSGAHRCGVRPDRAGDLADAIERAGLRLSGAFTHGGHAYDGPDAVASAAEDERSALEAARDSMRSHGHEPESLSAGSSPTALLSSRPPVNEERPGEYVFGDRDLVSVGTFTYDQVALVVKATVMSAVRPGQFVIDAGSKQMGREPSDILPGYGGIVELPDAVITKVSEECSVVETRGGTQPSLGDVVTVVPNHVCPVVNLSSELAIVRAGRLIDVWAVEARSNARGIMLSR